MCANNMTQVQTKLENIANKIAKRIVFHRKGGVRSDDGTSCNERLQSFLLPYMNSTKRWSVPIRFKI